VGGGAHTWRSPDPSGSPRVLGRRETPRRGIPYCRPLRPRSRGALAAKTLQEIGYTNVVNMEDGVNAWKEMGYETE
jgi:hypothetical protein